MHSLKVWFESSKLLIGIFLLLLGSTRVCAADLGEVNECQHALDKTSLDREEELAMHAVEKRREFKQLIVQTDKGWHIYIFGRLKKFSKLHECVWEVQVSTQYKDELNEVPWNTYLVSRAQKIMYKYDLNEGEYKKIK